VLIEPKLAAWLTAGLALYRANPLMIESIFFDSSQTGWPTFGAPGMVTDLEKLWIPNEYAGGVFRWAGEDFPLVSHTGQVLAVTGDPSLLENTEQLPYQIVPPAVQGLTELLNTEKFAVLTTFAQVPTQMPAITIRLEKDEQSDTYLGEALEHYGVDGVEFDVRTQGMTGAYLLSIWSTNREATLWLYAWLLHYCLNSVPQMNTWGLYDIAFAGSDLDPTLQYLAERVYTRHLLLTATRTERAVSTREVEWVSGLCVKVCAHYATLQTTVASQRF
jgi:hypothetical protein